MRLPLIPMLIVLLGTGACGVSEPKTNPPTLLVTNATCDSGPCVKFAVRGWESVYAVPGQPPAGFIVVGQVDSASACLRFPASVPFGDNTVWTPENSIGLTALAFESIVPLAYADSEIVPANAPGWHVTFPSGELTRAAPCQP